MIKAGQIWSNSTPFDGYRQFYKIKRVDVDNVWVEYYPSKDDVEEWSFELNDFLKHKSLSNEEEYKLWRIKQELKGPTRPHLNISSKQVKARSRKLKARWSIEGQQDLTTLKFP